MCAGGEGGRQGPPPPPLLRERGHQFEGRGRRHHLVEAGVSPTPGER